MALVKTIKENINGVWTYIYPQTVFDAILNNNGESLNYVLSNNYGVKLQYNDTTNKIELLSTTNTVLSSTSYSQITNISSIVSPGDALKMYVYTDSLNKGLYIWNGTSYQCVGRDYTNINIIDGNFGNATSTALNANLLIKRNTATYFYTNNPVLKSGEIGFETDTLKMKVGNGSTTWNLLSYINMVPSTYDTNNDGIVNQADKVTNSFTFYADSGSIEGTSKYTYNGSSAVGINFLSGTGISLSTGTGQITISNIGVLGVTSDSVSVEGLTINVNNTDSKHPILGLSGNISSSVQSYINTYRPYSDTNPLMNGTASQGTSSKISRQDHIHPTDTTRSPLDSPSFTGNPTRVTGVTDVSTGSSLTDKTYVDTKINTIVSQIDGMKYIGSLTAAATPATAPSFLNPSQAGYTWAVSGNGYVGNDGNGNSIAVTSGDLIICNTDNAPSTTLSYFDHISINRSGEVINNGTSIDGGIAVFDGTSGKLIKDSVKKITELVNSLKINGTEVLKDSFGVVNLKAYPITDNSTLDTTSGSGTTPDTFKIKDGGVGSIQIAAGAVLADKIGANQVNNTHILNDSLSVMKITIMSGDMLILDGGDSNF